MTTPVYEWAQVVEGVVGTGWGGIKFVSHHDLEFSATRRTGFLRNDRLNFRVICVDKGFMYVYNCPRPFPALFSGETETSHAVVK